MISNRTKRNIWLAFTFIGGGIVISRVIDLMAGGDWWRLLFGTALFLVVLKIYLSYRKAVNNGNLYGPVSPFRQKKS
ncbi:MAG: hypothetical protein K1V88_02455 [Muribaculaceae bacterium]|jgi:hypothetical protein|uniref:hypothetical protein n=1 Tax=uncultured Duncaniella sp. TaxID=2768039 RepID=UPI0027332EBD|nr:hypothetical protein [uncultured Duncaniella sp.]